MGLLGVVLENSCYWLVQLPWTVDYNQKLKNEPLRRSDTLQLFGRVGMTTADQDSAIPRSARFIMGIGGYVIDVGLDIALAVELHGQGEGLYFALTVAFIVFAPLAMTSYDFYEAEHKRVAFFNGLLNILMVRMIYLQVLVWAFIPDRLCTKELSVFRLNECIMKSFPQLCLQLYILYEQDESEVSVTRIASICSGVLSVAGVVLPAANI